MSAEVKAVPDGYEGITPYRGDRSGHFEGPFGHKWGFATHVENVSPEEMTTRAAAMHGG